MAKAPGRWVICQQPCNGGFCLGWWRTHDSLLVIGAVIYPSRAEAEWRLNEVKRRKKATTQKKRGADVRNALAAPRKSGNASGST